MNESQSLSPPLPPSSLLSTAVLVDERNSPHSGDEEDSCELTIVPKVMSQIRPTKLSTEKQTLIKLGSENTDVNEKTVMLSKEVKMVRNSYFVKQEQQTLMGKQIYLCKSVGMRKICSFLNEMNSLHPEMLVVPV